MFSVAIKVRFFYQNIQIGVDMKKLVCVFTLISSLGAFASSPSLICRDLVTETGAVKEVIIAPANQGADQDYLVQYHYIPPVNSSTTIVNETWADRLECNVDNKAPIAYCLGENNLPVAQVIRRSETYLDSIDRTAKKKTQNNVDIIVDNGEKRTISFAATHCHIVGGDA
jgi:hypothetical protein